MRRQCLLSLVISSTVILSSCRAEDKDLLTRGDWISLMVQEAGLYQGETVPVQEAIELAEGFGILAEKEMEQTDAWLDRGFTAHTIANLLILEDKAVTISDIENHPYGEDIQAVVDAGLMDIENDSFDPDGYVAESEGIAILDAAIERLNNPSFEEKFEVEEDTAVNITGILQRVTFPVLSTIQTEDERLRVNYRKFLRLSAYVVFPLMMGLAAVADPLIRWILTDKWEAAIPLLQILCFALMWYPIHAINLNLLQVKGRSDLFLKLEVWKKIIGVATLCVTIPLGLTAMCAGRVFTSLIGLVINTYYTGKLIQVGYWRQMKDLLPTLVNSVVMLLICWLVQLPVAGSHVLRLLLAVLAGCVYYVVSGYVFRSEELKELLGLIKRK